MPWRGPYTEARLSDPQLLYARAMKSAAAVLLLGIAACGGGDDGDSPDARPDDRPDAAPAPLCRRAHLRGQPPGGDRDQQPPLAGPPGPEHGEFEVGVDQYFYMYESSGTLPFAAPGGWTLTNEPAETVFRPLPTNDNCVPE